jgi:type II secretory pathway component GspD/PulD (secretin)
MKHLPPFLGLCVLAAVAVLNAQDSVPGGPVKVGAPVPPPPPQITPQSFTVFPDYGEGNAIANALRNSPPKLYNFDRASLRDVLRFLADDAGIPFVSMQDRTAPPTDGRPTSTIDSILVTFTMRASPFLVLESIAKANDIALVYESGVWFLRPFNERELIGRIYKLKFTPQERVTFASGLASGGSQTGDASSGSNNNQGQTAVPIFQVQQQQTIFQVQEPALVQEIKNMLKITSDGVTGRVSPQDASVGEFPPISTSPGINPGGSTYVPQQLSVVGGEPSVTFNSDTNTIYIVATRQQHQWVEGFLSAADRPQALIGIEVKFFETTRDPQQEIGINWAGTMAGGYDITLSQQVIAQGGVGYDINNTAQSGFNRSTTDSQTDSRVRSSSSFRNNEFQTGSAPIINVGENGTTSIDFLPPYSFDSGGSNNLSQTFSEAIDESVNNTLDLYSSLRNYQSSLGAAYTAVLSPRDISFAIEAFMEDRDTSIVQYPRVLTVNNREVAISNARNEPILVSDTTNASGGTSTQTQGVSYLPVGTQLNILPKIMPDGSVVMNVAINISNILRFKPLNVAGQVNEYPVTTSRVYQAALQVDSGYTLAVGGLEETFDEQVDNGVLLLKDIPGVGQLFKSKGRSQNKRNLVIFITPTVINDRTNTTGISTSPETVLPVRPDDPTPPVFGTDGRLVGGARSLNDAFAWLAFQNKLYKQISAENRVTTKSIKQLEGVLRTAEMILAEVEALAAANPGQAGVYADRLAQAQALYTRLEDTLAESRKNLFL